MFRFFNTFTHWILCASCYNIKGDLLPRILDKKKIEDTLLFGSNWESLPDITWLLAAKIRSQFQPYCYSTWIWYVYDAFFSKSRADFCFLWENDFDLFPYPPQRLFFLSLFHLKSIKLTSGIVSSCVLDSFILNSSFSSISEYLSSSVWELFLFTLLFQY